MCNLSAGIAERNYNHGLNHGIAIGDKQGRQEERISMLRNYMDTLHLTAQQAMDAAKIPKEEQEELKPYLKQ